MEGRKRDREAAGRCEAIKFRENLFCVGFALSEGMAVKCNLVSIANPNYCKFLDKQIPFLQKQYKRHAADAICFRANMQDVSHPTCSVM